MHPICRFIVVTGLVLTVGGMPSWGGPPLNPTPSDANGNTAGGNNVLNVNTGLDNTGFGDSVLSNNTEGASNTAIGVDTLHNNTVGDFNTAAGANALFNNVNGFHNTAIGVEALFDNISGIRNAAIGAKALRRNKAGSYNYALGWAALLRTTGNRNIGLGVTAGAWLTTGNDNIYLGHDGAVVPNTPVSESKTLRLGQAQTRTFIAGIRGVMLTGGSTVLINSSGQLGTVVSSSRYKRDIQDMREESQGLHKLRPVTFRYKEDAEGQRQYGLIAEEVATVYPDLVVRGEKGEVESVQYHELIPMLLNEVQHQQQELEELKAQNVRLQAALVQQSATLAARLDQLEQGARGMATVSAR